MKNILAKLSHINAILIITSIVLLTIFGFRNSGENLEKEYMCLTVEHETNHQLIYISSKEDTIKKIAFLDPERILNYRWLTKDYQKRGFVVNERSIESVYNYNEAFDLVSSYEKAGWVLVGYGFGVTSYDDLPNTRVSQYLMTRSKNH